MADATKYGFYQDVLVQENTDYTFSIDVDTKLWMECRALTTTTSLGGVITPTGIVNNSGWTVELNSNDYGYNNRRYVRTFNTGNYKAYRFFIYGINATSGYGSNKVGMNNRPQLELGNIATDWTPSPLDSQEEIDSKASADDINKIVKAGADNLLKNTKFEEDTYEAIITTSDFTDNSYNGWTIYNVSNDEEFISSGDLWTFTDTDDNDYELYGYQLDLSNQMSWDGSGMYWSDACMYQDVFLESQKDYVFSTYAYDEYLPYIKCVAINNKQEVANSGWDSKNFTWDSISISTTSGDGLCRVYKSFNTGAYAHYRIMIYGGWDYDADWGPEDYISSINYLQLERGTTPTKWDEGYNAIMDLQRQITDTIIQQNAITRHTNYMDSVLQTVHMSVEGFDNNYFHDSDWTNIDILFPESSSLTTYIPHKWLADNSPSKESDWGSFNRVIANKTTEYDTGYERFIIMPEFEYDYDATGETHSSGDIVYMDGGIYQDVYLNTNTNYTFSCLVYGYGNDIGGFIDCKALTYNAPHTIVANTGFDIQEWTHFSGTRAWTVEYPYNNGNCVRLYITFNTGSYNYYRFRIYGAAYWSSSSTFTKVKPCVNRLSLKKGDGTTYNDRIWERGEEYGLANLYYRSSISGILNTFYPVGSYYETSDTTFNPNTAWGGIWILETAGMVHVSSGTGYTVSGANSASGAGAKDGGEATHVLTPSETGIRNHTHTYSDYNTTYTLGTTKRKPGTSTAVAYGTSLTAGGGATTRTSNNPAAEANGAAHNNMQPYIVVNRWHRTA